MTTQPEASQGRLDTLKWLAVAIIVLGAIWANQQFAAQPLPLRVGGVVIALAIAAALALWTAKGQAALAFAKEARLEAKKVIWPTAPETRRTTLIIFAVVFIVGLALWGFDAIIVRLVALITHMEI